MKKLFKLMLIVVYLTAFIDTVAIAQKENLSELSIEQIMQGNNFIGHQPGKAVWSDDSKNFYFYWNPVNAYSDSLYEYNLQTKEYKKLDFETRWNLPGKGVFSKDRSMKVYARHGDIYLKRRSDSINKMIISTEVSKSNPKFIENDSKIAYQLGDNIFSWDIATGSIKQITNFKSGSKNKEKKEFSDIKQERWLYEDQLHLFQVLRQRKEKKEAVKIVQEKDKKKRIPATYLNGNRMVWVDISPDGQYVSYLVSKRPKSKKTIIPHYVTESGYTEVQNSRPKVGGKQPKYFLFILNLESGKSSPVDFTELEGYDYVPEYTKDYPNKKYENKDRVSYFTEPMWSKDGKHAVLDIKTNDHKDRWIALIDFEENSVKTLNHQHDEAWIGGPGIGWFSDYEIALGWMPDNKSVWFASEKTGYAHLYTVNIENRKQKALTKGKYEVYDPRISNDQKYWYFSSNKVHPGELHFYRMPIEGGKWMQITKMPGNNSVSLSPDEQYLAIRYSYSNKPWELYLMKNPLITGADEEVVQITNSTTKEFNAYNWRAPDVITFKSSDGKLVYARLYTPDDKVKNNAAIIFVHGAGYLQNAHKWWSEYYREYMFHNLLVDNGYTVLDIDYRGSAGYGRDWRTAIYRHMGGKDLSDQVDGAKFLVEKYGIDKNKVGIYGGSYGGFITLMAMFNAPNTFTAGAAIRSVTDWAHYNHGYTSNILNTPVTDSLAYVKSSPIYYANGLKGHLLILHGMVDDNVHFQDVVLLSQKLIELGKKNWEMAIYPVERHGFVEPSSWTDEYTRIFNLFQKYLLGKE